MAIFNEFPQTNFHELNLDWILDRIKHLDKRLITIEDFIDYLKNDGINDAVSEKIDSMVESGEFVQILLDYLPYVTPEMFNAAGDGVSNDTEPLQQAFNIGRNTGKIVILTQTYGVEETIFIYSDVEGNGVIKALAPMDYLIKTSDIVGIMRNKQCTINFDANNIAETGVSIGSSANCNFNIQGVKCKTVGVENSYIQSLENRFTIKVSCESDGLHQGKIGVLNNRHDSYYDEVVAVNFETAMELLAPTTINVFHPWIFHADYFEKSVGLVLGHDCLVSINWFYQDSIRTGIKTKTNKALADIQNYQVGFHRDYCDINTYPPLILDLADHSIIKIGLYNREISPIFPTNPFPFNATSDCRIFVTKTNNNYTYNFTDPDTVPTDGSFGCSVNINGTPRDVALICFSSELSANQMYYYENKWLIRTRSLWSSTWGSWREITTNLPGTYSRMVTSSWYTWPAGSDYLDITLGHTSAELPNYANAIIFAATDQNYQFGVTVQSITETNVTFRCWRVETTRQISVRLLATIQYNPE